jgi:hypothetical protein
LGEVFEISRRDTSELPRGVTGAIEQYGLRFSVSAVPPADADPWLSENGTVVFKFWATDFPNIHFFTGNDPAVR